ncbi:reverse transcriptase domain-containing protein [Tanacetum coccineum]
MSLGFRLAHEPGPAKRDPPRGIFIINGRNLGLEDKAVFQDGSIDRSILWLWVKGGTPVDVATSDDMVKGREWGKNNNSEFMLWNSLLLLECSSSSYFAAVSILKLTLPTGRYVVPTGRVIATDSVIVATSGYVVPADFDIRPGRVKLVDSAFQTQLGRNLEAYVDDMVIKSRTEKDMIMDVMETFDNLRKVNIKLNPKKCSFRVKEGKFHRYIITSEGIRSNPKKTKAVADMQSPKTLREMQSLSGKLATLNRFLSRSVERAMPFFDTLKNITKENKDDFRWTEAAEQSFQELKAVIMELPALTTPNLKETLYVYLAASEKAVSRVVMADRRGKQTPIWYVSRTLHEAEKNYTSLEKLALCLLHLSRRLRRCFKAHPIKVITDQPIKQILNKPDASGKLAKYAVELGAYNIAYMPRKAVKGQVLADFLNEVPVGMGHIEVCSLADDTKLEEWTLFTDGASSLKGAGAGLVLIDPSGTEYTYAIRLNFASTNNEAEHEALLVGL